ncbi:MAG: ATP-binding protein [Patescibacteria group bacterium]
MNKRSVIGIFADMAVAMSSEPFSEALRVAARSGAEIAGSSRCCIILKNKKDELKIKAGFPDGAHGIGEKITGAGEKHLRRVMDECQHVFVSDAASDQQTTYMRPLVTQQNIASIFFVPLVSEKETIGVMAFDFVAQTEKRLVDAATVARYLAREIKILRQQKREKEKAERLQRLTALGEHSAKIAHIIRNALTNIVGNLRHLKEGALLSDHDRMHALIVYDALETLDRRVNQVLAFAKFSPEHLDPKPHKISDVLAVLIGKMRTLHPKIHIHFSKKHNGTTLQLNKDWIESCVDDIVRNAADAEAKNIWVETRKLSKEGRFTISIRNDGEPIDLKKINAKDFSEIFDAFCTTKEKGFGLGLSIVQAMVQCHGGEISVESSAGDPCIEGVISCTTFKISLPL